MESITFTELLTVVVASLALVFSIISYYNSHRVQLRITEASTYSGIMERLFELNKIEVENPDFFKILFEEFDNTKTTKGGNNGMGHYLYMLFNLFEEIYVHYKVFKLMQGSHFEVWKARITNDFANRPFLLGYWKYTIEHFPTEYHDGFIDFINYCIAKAENIKSNGPDSPMLKVEEHSEKH